MSTFIVNNTHTNCTRRPSLCQCFDPLGNVFICFGVFIGLADDTYWRRPGHTRRSTLSRIGELVMNLSGVTFFAIC